VGRTGGPKAHGGGLLADPPPIQNPRLNNTFTVQRDCTHQIRHREKSSHRVYPNWSTGRDGPDFGPVAKKKIRHDFPRANPSKLRYNPRQVENIFYSEKLMRKSFLFVMVLAGSCLGVSGCAAALGTELVSIGFNVILAFVRTFITGAITGTAV